MASVRIGFCSVLVLMAGYSALAAAADPAAKPNDDQQGAARMKLLRELAEKVQVSVVGDGKPTPLKMLSEPLYRYHQKSLHFPDAVVWAWGDGGRPTALLSLICEVRPERQQLCYVFNSLSHESLSCRIEGMEWWSPWDGPTEMKPLPNAPAPAEDQAGRLQQITALTARMEAAEGPHGRLDLSWLPQPVYRYSDPAHGTIDGALCFACDETNPGVLLLLEAQRRGSSPPAWYCGFVRHSYASLRVRFDGKGFWTAPQLSTTMQTEPYYITVVPLTAQ